VIEMASEMASKIAIEIASKIGIEMAMEMASKMGMEMVSEMVMEMAMEMTITSQSNRQRLLMPAQRHCSNHFFAAASHSKTNFQLSSSLQPAGQRSRPRGRLLAYRQPPQDIGVAQQNAQPWRRRT
jgi:hypothetical protein